MPIENEENVYAAEALLKDRKRKGKTEYLVKWKGWGAKHNSWEPRENILDERLFAEYDARRNKKSERKRSGGASSSKKPTPTKRSRRLAGGEVNDESDDDEDYEEEEEEDTPAPSPSTSKGRQRRTLKVTKKEKEATEKVSSEKKSEGKPSDKGTATKEDEKPKEDKKKEETESKPTEEVVKETPKAPKQAPEKPKEPLKTKSAIIPPEDKPSTSGITRKDPPQTSAALPKKSAEKEGEKEQKDEPKRTTKTDEEPKSAVTTPPKVYYGHMTSIQIASSSNGQEQLVSTNAFVVSPPGASGSTEQMQVCERDDLAKIQAIKNEIISETKQFLPFNDDFSLGDASPSLSNSAAFPRSS